MAKDFTEFKEVLLRGIQMRGDVEKAVAQIMEKGVNSIYLVGCGGSLAVMSPIRYIFQIHSPLPVYEFNSSEFVNVKPVGVSKDSLIILSSYTGSTKETVAAAQWAKSLGAATLGFAGKADSPLGHAVDYIFANDAKIGVTNAKMITLYQVAFGILHHRGEFSRYDDIIAALEGLPSDMVTIKEMAEDFAKNFAEAYKDATYFMTLGAGILWGETYSYATCILEEMQWIHARSVHGGEFFHGSFEIVEEDTNLLVFQGEDRTRPVMDRVLAFAERFNKRTTLIDTKNYPLAHTPEDLREYMSPFVLSAVLDRISDNLQEIRNHPLSTRRYMFKVEY